VANYDWREYQGRNWSDRFPQNVRGYTVWRLQSLERRFDLKALAASVIEARERATTGPPRPCVFISHRQADAAPATRIAYLACQEGFDYWLDVLDPALSGVAGAPSLPSTADQAAATAAVIEMALLNSSHVVAVMTPNTRGSQWVPYEYGRVKAPDTTSLQAAIWLDKSVPASSLPEYVHLGAILKSELEIRQWLKSELQKHPARSFSGSCQWQGAMPAPL
jgi:hypothetical protein